MQTQFVNRNIDTENTTFLTQEQTTRLQLIKIRARRRTIRAAIPIRSREECLTKQARLAALREAELNEWLATGGDFLDAMHQPAA